MKLLRIIMLGLALVAGGLAILVMMNGPAPVPEAPTPQVAAPPPMEEVLVATNDLPAGRMIDESDFTWQRTAPANVQPNMILRSNGEAALNDLRGAYVRQAISAGEPIRRERLLRAGRPSAFMAANLPPDMRAIAIAIDPAGLATAGGFVQPGDRVDILRLAASDDGSGADPQGAQLVMSNIRVLAIGAAADRNLERPINANTATVEVTPAQAERLLVAQRGANLTLVLRSALDRTATQQMHVPQPEGLSNIVRYGVISGVR